MSLMKTIGASMVIMGAIGLVDVNATQRELFREYLSKHQELSSQTVKDARDFASSNKDYMGSFAAGILGVGAGLYFAGRKKED